MANPDPLLVPFCKKIVPSCFSFQLFRFRLSPLVSAPSAVQSPRTLLFLMIFLCREAGESSRGAGLLRPFEGRDKIAPLPSFPSGLCALCDLL